ncbi:hypothetical protein ID741_000644 [Enterococcus sp. AZ103]
MCIMIPLTNQQKQAFELMIRLLKNSGVVPIQALYKHRYINVMSKSEFETVTKKFVKFYLNSD